MLRTRSGCIRLRAPPALTACNHPVGTASIQRAKVFEYGSSERKRTAGLLRRNLSMRDF